MADIEVTNTQAQRNGNDIFTIDITRTSGNRSLSFTEPELEAVIQREDLRIQRTMLEIQEANLDGVDPSALRTTVNGLIINRDDAKSARQLMDD